MKPRKQKRLIADLDTEIDKNWNLERAALDDLKKALTIFERVATEESLQTVVLTFRLYDRRRTEGLTLLHRKRAISTRDA